MARTTDDLVAAQVTISVLRGDLDDHDGEPLQARNIPTDCSCYADTPPPGTPRVMRLQVDLPHGARFIPADSKQEGRERRGRDEEGGNGADGTKKAGMARTGRRRREWRGRDEEGGNGADGTNAGWDVGGRAFR